MMAIEPTGNRGTFRVLQGSAKICPRHTWRSGLEVVRGALARGASFDVPIDFTTYETADCRGKHRSKCCKSRVIRLAHNKQVGDYPCIRISRCTI